MMRNICRREQIAWNSRCNLQIIGRRRSMASNWASNWVANDMSRRKKGMRKRTCAFLFYTSVTSSSYHQQNLVQEKQGASQLCDLVTLQIFDVSSRLQPNNKTHQLKTHSNVSHDIQTGIYQSSLRVFFEYMFVEDLFLRLIS